MTNNLEKAKELKFRKKELLEGVKYLNSYELKTLSEIKKEAKDLKEKIESEKNLYLSDFGKRRKENQEAIKICEEILK